MGIGWIRSGICPGGGGGGANWRANAVSPAALVRHSARTPASTGSRLELGDFSIRLVIIFIFRNLTYLPQPNLPPAENSGSPPESSSSRPAKLRPRGETRRQDSYRSGSPSAVPPR